jgi:membrane dipeptidase
VTSAPFRAVPDVLLLDGHSDVLIDVFDRRARGEIGSLGSRHVPRWRAGRVAAALCAVTVEKPDGEPLTPAVVLDRLRQARAEIEAAHNDVTLARTADEVVAAWGEGRIALVLGVEGGAALGHDPSVLAELHDAGLRWATLTWNDRNALADGVGVPAPRGLTELGVRMVRALNDQGILVDVSHAHPRTVFDVLRSTRAPVVATHSNARAVWDHPRNLDDASIRGIAASGGTIGVNLFPALVGEDPGLDDVVDHVAYLVATAGPGAIAIGADFIDFAQDAFRANLQRASVDYGTRFDYPEGVENTTRLANLLRAVERRGFDPDVVAGLAGLNLVRVLREVQRLRREENPA